MFQTYLTTAKAAYQTNENAKTPHNNHQSLE